MQVKTLQLHDNRVICSHAAECVNDLPSVFRLGERRWINPDAAEVDDVIDVIKKCPSGALSYSIENVRHTLKNLPTEITVTKDGPYHITGKIQIKDENNLQPPNPELYSICRCGASKNKPFCDGVHHEIEFKD